MARQDFYGDVRNGYAYYVYTTASTRYDPMQAYGILRTRTRGRAERLVDDEWEYDPHSYGDIIGITGATGVKKVSPEQLKDIIRANSKDLDPEKW